MPDELSFLGSNKGFGGISGLFKLLRILVHLERSDDLAFYGSLSEFGTLVGLCLAV